MIFVKDNLFHLQTKHTSYVFRVMDTGHLEHLHYGRKITCESDAALTEQHAFQPGNTVAYDNDHASFSLEDQRLEFSSLGKGDVREPFVEIVHADGAMTCDFLYDSYELTKGKEPFETLPGSYDENGEADHLKIVCKDDYYHLALELHYFVYEDCDVITRSSKLYNEGTEMIQLKRLMSTQLDFLNRGYRLTSFHGAWAREMERTDVMVTAGKFVSESRCGTSSSRSNPFVMISTEQTTEEVGDCYGCNLIYSGNHYEALEATVYGKSRFVSGLQPMGFSYCLEGGDSFEAPEAVMTFSEKGFSGMSTHMHDFVREHIVRGEWKYKNRPVLLNSWEAAYFQINEKKLLKLATAAKKAGMELFVMDDGWFGTRDDDTQSLGDWTVNEKKLPNGVKGLADKIKALGLDFGIWVEPEMVNVKSNLYREHPEWVMEIPGKAHSEGRNQRILDMGNPKVQEYVIEEMTKVFSMADISYVKWDMNRIFSDVYSQILPPERQGEASHRYVMGLYRCMKELTERFPHILFEGCSAGGNRFDLGILCYFPQIWASDNTDAVSRVNMMTNYSYGYPMSVVSAHVSACPNHQTLRNTPLETRFHVASFGICGYECNLSDLSEEEQAAVAVQVALYKEWRDVLQWGDFYRGRNGNLHEWTVVSKDKKKAVGMIMQELVAANSQFEQYFAKGLLASQKYQFKNHGLKINIKDFGDLVNTMSPVHIKNNSMLQDLLARFYKLPGETEDAVVSGDTLMYAGYNLKQAFSATGISDQVRHFPDFASRLYFMEAVEEES